MFKKLLSGIMAVAVCVVGLSGCGESPPEETETTVETEMTAPNELTEEEMQIWESMPDIVTMRVLNHYETETTEIMYIEKSGAMKSFVCDEYFDVSTFTGNITEWFKENLGNFNKIVKKDTINVKQLITLYTLFTESNNDSKLTDKNLLSTGVQRETTHSFQIYINTNENVFFPIGTGLITVGGRVNNERILDCVSGIDIYVAYIEIDSFINMNTTNIDA